MSTYNESDHARSADGKYAPKETSETDAAVLSTPGTVTVKRAATQWSPAVYQYPTDEGVCEFVRDKYATRYSSFYDKDHQLHRTDGPARIDRDISWWRHGKSHRPVEEGPAFIEADGQCSYWEDGKLVAPDSIPATTLARQGVERVRHRGRVHLYYPETAFGNELERGYAHPEDPKVGELHYDERFGHYYDDDEGDVAP